MTPVQAATIARVDARIDSVMARVNKRFALYRIINALPPELLDELSDLAGRAPPSALADAIRFVSGLAVWSSDEPESGDAHPPTTG